MVTFWMSENIYDPLKGNVVKLPLVTNVDCLCNIYVQVVIIVYVMISLRYTEVRIQAVNKCT